MPNSDTPFAGLPSALRAALTNGVTREEIKEILLQTCIYCGIPAGLDAFKTAVEVFKEVDQKKKA